MASVLLASFVGTTFITGSVQAATVVGFKLGGDYWRVDTSGTFADASTTQPQQSYNYSQANQGSYWVAIEHPVPILPNFKIRHNSLDVKGHASVTDYTFDDLINVTGDVTSYSNLTNTDFVLYYELLDNDIVSLDLGASYKLMDGSIRVNYDDTNGRHHGEKALSSGIVMVYADAQAGIPGIGLYGFTDVMVGASETGVYDFTLGLGWQFDSMAVDTNLRLGYRDFKFDVNDFDDVTANMGFKGYFAGVELVF